MDSQTHFSPKISFLYSSANSSKLPAACITQLTPSLSPFIKPDLTVGSFWHIRQLQSIYYITLERKV